MRVFLKNKGRIYFYSHWFFFRNSKSKRVNEKFPKSSGRAGPGLLSVWKDGTLTLRTSEGTASLHRGSHTSCDSCLSSVPVPPFQGEDSPSGEQTAMWLAPTLHLSFLRHLLAPKGFYDFIGTSFQFWCAFPCDCVA